MRNVTLLALNMKKKTAEATAHEKLYERKLGDAT